MKRGKLIVLSAMVVSVIAVVLLIGFVATKTETRTAPNAALPTNTTATSAIDLSYPNSTVLVFQDAYVWPHGRPAEFKDWTFQEFTSNDDYQKVHLYYKHKLPELGFNFGGDGSVTCDGEDCNQSWTLNAIKNNLQVIIGVTSADEQHYFQQQMPQLLAQIKPNQTLISIGYGLLIPKPTEAMLTQTLQLPLSDLLKNSKTQAGPTINLNSNYQLQILEEQAILNTNSDEVDFRLKYRSLLNGQITTPAYLICDSCNIVMAGPVNGNSSNTPQIQELHFHFNYNPYQSSFILKIGDINVKYPANGQ